jgi:hypothetical protein
MGRLGGLFMCGLLLCLSGAQAHAQTNTGTNYYLSPTGNDNNDGLTQATAWATPNHAVKCGDTVGMLPGNYNAANLDTGKWGAATSTDESCASEGGTKYAKLMCLGHFVQDCKSIGAPGTHPFNVTASNWMIITAYAEANYMWGSCFTRRAPFVVFVNVYANKCGAGVGGGEYGAHIGMISYGGANGGGAAFSGLSIFHPVAFDTKSGTPVFEAGIFSWNNINPPGYTDGEGVIFDDWMHKQDTKISYTQQGVLEQSLILGNGSNGVEIFQSAASFIIIDHVTSWGNLQDNHLHRPPGGPELLLNVDWGGRYQIAFLLRIGSDVLIVPLTWGWCMVPASTMRLAAAIN